MCVLSHRADRRRNGERPDGRVVSAGELQLAVTVIDKDDQYVLNHCTRYLAREPGLARHDFGQYAPGDPAAAVCEAWRFPVVDAHYDGVSTTASYAFNDVTFVHDGRAAAASAVAVVGMFCDLYAPVPLRPVQVLGADS